MSVASDPGPVSIRPDRGPTRPEVPDLPSASELVAAVVDVAEGRTVPDLSWFVIGKTLTFRSDDGRDITVSSRRRFGGTVPMLLADGALVPMARPHVRTLRRTLGPARLRVELARRRAHEQSVVRPFNGKVPL